MSETPVRTDYHLETSKHGNAVVVRFGGCRILDEHAVNSIGLELFAVADRDDVRCLILNFCGVEGLSSLMLGKILMLRSEMTSKGGALMLCGLRPELLRLFSTTKLDLILDIKDGAADALKAGRSALRTIGAVIPDGEGSLQVHGWDEAWLHAQLENNQEDEE